MIMRLPLVLVLSSSLGACGAAQAVGVSANLPRDVEIANQSKSKVCEVELVNEKQVSGPKSVKTKIEVEPGATKTVKVDMAIDQERKAVFRDCKGVSLKEMPVPPGKEKVSVSIP